MPSLYDVKLSFQLPLFKLLFKELFLKKYSSLKVKIKLINDNRKNNYKTSLYKDRRISIVFSEDYFTNRFWKRNNNELAALIFEFIKFLLLNLKEGNDNKFLIKVIYCSKNRNKLCFLFNEIQNFTSFEKSYLEVIKTIQKYRSKDGKVIKEIKESFKLKSREIYYELKDNNWTLINLLFNAGKYHHDFIAKENKDNRIAKPHILVNENCLIKSSKRKALWQIKARKLNFVRSKPNDVALYSHIAISNLEKAKEIYNSKNSFLWKAFQTPEDEIRQMDYYELIITSIILAYSSIEALINIVIPNNYMHKRREKNKDSGRMIIKKFSKREIERWYNMDDKMNIVLPDAINIPKSNQENWWMNFTKLEKLRNKVIHVVESKSNERYSELLEKQVFDIVESHIDIIKFFGKWATDNKHYLLNELPYGFGYDDIMPILISNKDYNEEKKERRGIII